MKLTKLSRLPKVVEEEIQIFEGVRMTLPAFKKAIAETNALMGFELEFMVPDEFTDGMADERSELLAPFEDFDSRVDGFDKESMESLSGFVDRNVLGQILTYALATKFDEATQGFDVPDDIYALFEPLGLKTPEAIADAIMDAAVANAAQFGRALRQNGYRVHHWEAASDEPDEFREHLIAVLDGEAADLGEQDASRVSTVIYSLTLGRMFRNYDISKMDDSLFEEIFVDGLESDVQFKALFGGNMEVGNEMIGAFIAREAGIHIKDSSESYHGAERDFEGSQTGYYIEKDGDGPELVSDPMPLNKAVEDLGRILQVIENHFETDGSRGLHINVSIPGMTLDSVNLLKLALFLGENHLLNQFDRMGNEYAMPQLVNLTDYLRGLRDQGHDLFMQTFAKKGDERLNSKVNGEIVDYMLRQSKNHTFNALKLTSKNPYIEFRIMGNEGYEKRFPEIVNQIHRYVYVLQLAMDPDAERAEYAKKLWKLVSSIGESAAKRAAPASMRGAFGPNVIKKVEWVLGEKAEADKRMSFALFEDGSFSKAIHMVVAADAAGREVAEEVAHTALLGLALIYRHQKARLIDAQIAVARALNGMDASDGRMYSKWVLEKSLGDARVLFDKRDTDTTLTFAGTTYAQDDKRLTIEDFALAILRDAMSIRRRYRTRTVA
jgi:hypothetical protein